MPREQGKRNGAREGRSARPKLTGQDVAMLVLLPPSEGKSAPTRGRPLDLSTLSSPMLNPARERLLTALTALARAQPDELRKALGISENQRDELRRNRALLTAPTTTAAKTYTGVLYDALALETLDPAAKRRAGQRIAIMSALYGVLRPTDRIAAYRLSGDSVLPGVGPLAPLWREPLALAMTDLVRDRAVLDLRSGAYAGLWRPDEDIAQRTLILRVVQGKPDGSRTVVSHFNKATKGRLTRALMSDPTTARTTDDLVAAVGNAGFSLDSFATTPRGTTADLVVTEI